MRYARPYGAGRPAGSEALVPRKPAGSGPEFDGPGRGSVRAWAAGYASSPVALEDDLTWVRWRAEIESHAAARYRLAGVFTDGNTGGAAAGADGARRGPANSGSGTGADTGPGVSGAGSGAGLGKGMAGLLRLVRERAHLRDGHVQVLLVPTVEHLSWRRDGTHDTVRLLLNLHLGLRVVEIQRPSDGPQPPSEVWRPGGFGGSDFTDILMGRGLPATGAAATGGSNGPRQTHAEQTPRACRFPRPTPSDSDGGRL